MSAESEIKQQLTRDIFDEGIDFFDFNFPEGGEQNELVGHSGGSGARKIFPIRRENSNSIEVVGRLALPGKDQWNRVYGTGGVAPALSTMQGGRQEPKVLVNINQRKLQPRNDFTCLDANYAKELDNHGARTGVLEPVPVLTPDRPEKRQNGRRFKEPGEPMFTLTAQDRHGVAIAEPKGLYVQTSPEFMRQPLDGMSRCLKSNKHDAGIIDTNYRIRKLTPLECFRLQSYPDWWYVKLKLFRHPELMPLVDMSRNDITEQVMSLIGKHHPLYPDQMVQAKEGISDSQLYKMAGNGVTSAVAYDIGIRLKEIYEMEETN